MDGNNTTITSKLSIAYIDVRTALHYLEAIVIVCVNIVTLIAVRRTKKLRRVPTNIFITNLAASDGMIGLAMPFMSLFDYSATMGIWKVYVCTIVGPYYAIFNTSLCTMLAIAVDRYIAVVHPLFYRRRMTTKIAFIVSLLIWVIELTFLTSLTCYYGSRVIVQHFHPSAMHKLFPTAIFYMLTQTQIIMPIGINVILYLWIYIKLKKNSATISVPSSNSTQGSSGFQVAQRTKAFTKMMAMVLGYLLLALMPYYILVFFYDVTDPRTPAWYIYLFDISILLFFSNSFMNPVIYSWKSRQFRDAYKKLLKCNNSETNEIPSLISTSQHL